MDGGPRVLGGHAEDPVGSCMRMSSELERRGPRAELGRARRRSGRSVGRAGSRTCVLGHTPPPNSQGQGRWRRTCWAGSVEHWETWWDPRACSSGGSLSPEEHLLPLAGSRMPSLPGVLPSWGSPPGSSHSNLLPVSRPLSGPSLSCSLRPKGAGARQPPLSLSPRPEAEVVCRPGLAGSALAPWLFTFMHRWTWVWWTQATCEGSGSF